VFLRRRQRLCQRKEREYQVVRRKRAEDTPQVEALDVLLARCLQRMKQDRANEKAAQDEEQIHSEEDRDSCAEKRGVKLKPFFRSEDPAHMVLNHAKNGDDTQSVQNGIPIVEQLKREERWLH
jgi:hypothetical protein